VADHRRIRHGGAGEGLEGDGGHAARLAVAVGVFSPRPVASRNPVLSKTAVTCAPAGSGSR
jgi:hypothetical protein